MRSKSPVYAYVLVAAATAALISIFANPGICEPYMEGGAYFQMAQGHPETTYNYYAGRMLHPYAARMLANAARIDLHRAFFVLAVISLFALFVFLSLYTRKLNLKPALLIPLLCVPATITLYHGCYFHDLFHAMLVAAFFVIYSYSAWVALPILFFLHLTRESTILLSAWLALMSLRRRDWPYGLGVVIVAALGMGVTTAAVHAALPNKHGVSTVEMYVLKVPYAFCYNFLGLVFWTDTNASTINCAPRSIINVAGHLGSIRQVGFCGFRPRLILETLAVFLVPFGVEPAILARLVREHWRALPKYGYVFQTAFGYGATCLVLAPVTGPGPARYFLYAWPLYWLALPELLKGLTFDRSLTIALLALHAAACVVGFSIPYGAPWYGQLSIVAVLLALNAMAYHCVFKMVPVARRT
ncbi:MAG: hypothetical protein ABSA59_07545 [Terriglobia bacterium]|jgi:hypothetical protein